MHNRPKIEPIDPPPPLIPSDQASSPRHSRSSSPAAISPPQSPHNSEKRYNCESTSFCTCCMPKSQQSSCQCQMCTDSSPISPMFPSYPYCSPYREGSINSRHQFDRDGYKMSYPTMNIHDCPPHLLPSYSKYSFPISSLKILSNFIESYSKHLSLPIPYSCILHSLIVLSHKLSEQGQMVDLFCFNCSEKLLVQR